MHDNIKYCTVFGAAMLGALWAIFMTYLGFSDSQIVIIIIILVTIKIAIFTMTDLDKNEIIR